MRLTTIKLAGFKSFVDPTTLHLPTNMSGIVGPNGCGKSNIIDAIRWVMGESAASRLRGDSLTDVIFSGSSGAQAGRQRDGRTAVRQLRRPHRRRIRELHRDLGQAHRQPRWPVAVFPERRALPPPRHHRYLPWHRPWPAQLLDHRAGHDQRDRRSRSGASCAVISKKPPASPSTRSAARKPRAASRRRARISIACATCATRSKSSSST